MYWISVAQNQIEKKQEIHFNSLKQERLYKQAFDSTINKSTN